MSLDRKRRIFRPAALQLPRPPSTGLVLTALAAICVVGAGLWLMLGSSEAPAQPPVAAHLAAEPSQVAVIDGGTLRVRDTVVALDGIAPAARGSYCHQPDGAEKDCGAAAANMLAALMRNAHRIECAVHGRDDKERALATCDARGLSLNRALVRAGLARATGTQPSLRSDEAQAKADGRGIWATP